MRNSKSMRKKTREKSRRVGKLRDAGNIVDTLMPQSDQRGKRVSQKGVVKNSADRAANSWRQNTHRPPAIGAQDSTRSTNSNIEPRTQTAHRERKSIRRR